MVIRQATHEDLPKLETAGREAYASSKHFSPFEMERFLSAWTKLLDGGTGAVFIAEDAEGKVHGAIGGVIYPDLYTSRMIATEFFWFMRPGHRGPGLQLYYRFEEWAREKCASQIRMTHLCDLMPEDLKWLYGELGFDPIEINYAKELAP